MTYLLEFVGAAAATVLVLEGLAAFARRAERDGWHVHFRQ